MSASRISGGGVVAAVLAGGGPMFGRASEGGDHGFTRRRGGPVQCWDPGLATFLGPGAKGDHTLTDP